GVNKGRKGDGRDGSSFAGKYGNIVNPTERSFLTQPRTKNSKALAQST
ncbi:MAG: hypothetical protein ACI9G1_004091, partial [Pirellulaceae bacterium]